MLFQPSLDEIIGYAINHIKSFPIQVHYQYKPQTVKPSLLVYRLSKGEKPKYQRYYKTLPDRNFHKIADAKLTNRKEKEPTLQGTLLKKNLFPT